jgi:hypothetical protein
VCALWLAFLFWLWLALLQELACCLCLALVRQQALLMEKHPLLPQHLPACFLSLLLWLLLGAEGHWQAYQLWFWSAAWMP